MLLSRFIQCVLFNSIIYLIQSDNQFYRVQPHDISALIGSNVTIPCVIASPHGDIQWTKDGLALGYDRQLPAFPSWSIIGDENQGEFNFFIQALKLDDEGIFACEVSPYQDAPALRHIAHLRTLARPEQVRIKDRADTVNIRFDETIHQIECQVDGARPAAHIRWFNESGQEFPATSRVVAQDRLFSTISTLTLVPSLSLHKKRFTCDVQHETFMDITHVLRTSFEVQITSPPSIPSINGYASTSRLINGSYLTLSCQSFGGSPFGRLSWYRLDDGLLNSIDNSSMVLPERNFVENNISMIIKPSDNNLTFSCHVTNDYLQSIGEVLQKNITLHVAFGPTSVYIRDIHANETTLIEGIPRAFICRTSSSNPPAIITWKLDGIILHADINSMEELGEYGGKVIQSTKTIGLDKLLRDYHKKTLSCEAKNADTGHVITDSTRLNVIFDATNIEMHGLTTDKIIKSGQTIAVECILKGGNPLGKIIWYKGNELLASESTSDANGTNVISRVNFVASPSDNNLPLTCKGQVENFPQKLASFVLNITFLPEEIMIIDNSTLSNLSSDHDNSKIYECRTSISNPQVQLTVFREGKNGQKYLDIQYKTSTTYINGINSIQFTLPPIDLSFHENRLICEAMLDIEIPPLIKQVYYTIYVHHKPYFSDFNSSFEVIEHQSFNITLTANGYPLPINYTWLHPAGRQLMSDQMNIFVNDNQLSLMNVQRTDLGVYRCIATNSLGTTEVNFTLNVLYGPVITLSRGYSITDALVSGSPAMLLCVIDANPIDLNTVRWYKGQQEISFDQWEKRIEGKEASIIRKSVQQDDAGEYTCQIENQFGTTQAKIPLFVQYAPKIDRTDTKVAVDSERYLPAEFHCRFSAIPKPTVLWLKDNQVLPISSKYQSMLTEQPSLPFDAVLHVSNITKSDYGIYQCKVENALGTDTIEFNLSGLTIPDPPRDIRLVNVSYSSALISWLPGFDGGAQQTFQVRYRLSTADRYSYEHLPLDAQTFELTNLRLFSEYRLSLRSNNSYHLSSWSQELTIKTLNFTPTFSYPVAGLSPQTISFTIIFILAIIGLVLFLISSILLVIFIFKRRRSNIHAENLSTTETNETETNTIDLFQPISQKYEDEDIKKPFVSSGQLLQSGFIPEQNDHFSLYDNLRLHQYYPMNFDNGLITYRSFKVNVNDTSDLHECVRAELV